MNPKFVHALNKRVWGEEITGRRAKAKLSSYKMNQGTWIVVTPFRRAIDVGPSFVEPSLSQNLFPLR